MFCTDVPAPFLLIFSETVPQLLYFSHIPTAFIALILGFFVFSKTRKGRNKFAGQLLLIVSLLFTVWSILDIILWTNIDSDRVAFVWSIINFMALLVSSCTLYFSYVFLENKDAPLPFKVLIGFLLLSYAVFIPTNINLDIFNLSNCEFEEGLLVNYYYFLEIVFFSCLLIYLIKKIAKAGKERKKIIALFSLGVICFLLSFSGSNLFGNITKHWEIAQYGLFGMPLFMAFLIYLIIEYRVFNIKLLAAQALIISIIILIGSQFFFIQTDTNRTLTAIILFLVIIFGFWLVKSVKKEYEQKEELEIANIELKKLDQAKSDFINIASHQLRTPITVIQGVASMMLEGDMDKMPLKEKQEFYRAVYDKSRKLQTIIHDILNSTELEGKEYNAMDEKMNSIDLQELIGKVIKDFEVEAKERDLDLIFIPTKENIPKINGQEKYLEEAFINLINNAVKYTPSGKITNEIRIARTKKGRAKIEISIENNKDNKGVLIKIKDNGIGIPVEAAPNLFKRFSRAKNAVNMYTDGTGLGLYIVKEIVEGHGGKVWFESELNKGTTFFVDLPIVTKELNIKKRILSKDS
ncbi:MAG: HAMP domain-containing sensor histidine kinase [Candidatus Paceibacterota bacterium]|jgi:signal transduction histidine kinase|nr:HAMP domain-containing histidine kinase [bacterium]